MVRHKYVKKNSNNPLIYAYQKHDLATYKGLVISDNATTSNQMLSPDHYAFLAPATLRSGRCPRSTGNHLTCTGSYSHPEYFGAFFGHTLQGPPRATPIDPLCGVCDFGGNVAQIRIPSGFRFRGHQKPIRVAGLSTNTRDHYANVGISIAKEIPLAAPRKMSVKD